MGALRTYLSTLLRKQCQSRDVFVGQRGTFGLNAMADVQRLAKCWDYPMNDIFDVGANDGGTALELLRSFPSAHITSFEPHPATFDKLTTRIGKNQRFRAFNLALGDVVGEADMAEYENSKINSLLSDAPFAKRFNEKSSTIRIATTTLDAFTEQNSIACIDLLKIDTEGYELQVLEGSRNMLQKGLIKYVYLEFNDLFPRQGSTGGALMPLAGFLNQYGYRFVASYNDYITTEGEMFSVSNALFVLPPNPK